MSEPNIKVTIELLGHAEETLGQMDFELPTQILAEHSSPEKLEKLVTEDLMPDAVEQCLQAHIASIAPAARDTELERVNRATMKMFVNDEGEALEFELKFNHG